ncbi:MAG: MerR family transcriptional regulator [Planctomycetaceae bacterium]|jgi:DNA-binding transcriptional MerR regulator|nr:MerR family transcriptional regulator [Planctomycetaceae bacterium]
MTIAEVAKKHGLSPDTLRYYERVGLIPNVKRNENGIRNYSEEDNNWVGFIKCMRSAGVQVEALVEYVALFQQGESTHSDRKQILVEQRNQLVKRLDEMKSTLKRLNNKIENYDQLYQTYYEIRQSGCAIADIPKGQW